MNDDLLARLHAMYDQRLPLGSDVWDWLHAVEYIAFARAVRARRGGTLQEGKMKSGLLWYDNSTKTITQKIEEAAKPQSELEAGQTSAAVPATAGVLRGMRTPVFHALARICRGDKCFVLFASNGYDVRVCRETDQRQAFAF